MIVSECPVAHFSAHTLDVLRVHSRTPTRFGDVLSICLESILIIAVMMLSGCGFTRFREAPFNPEKPPACAIVFVPGFKGSVLTDNDGHIVWIDALGALRNSGTLALDEAELELPDVVPLQAVSVLDTVSVIPGIYQYHLYDLWLDGLKKDSGECDVVPFSYDWRRDIPAAAAQLADLVDSLHGAGTRRVVIVSHSMGSLVTAYYLRYGRQPVEAAVESWHGANDVDAAVMIGAPYRGAATMLRDMQEGVETLWNRTLLQPDAVASFQSSFQLLPFPSKSLLVSVDPTHRSLDWRHPEAWNANNWGILGSSSAGNRQRRLEYVTRELDNARLFSNLINAPTDRTPTIPILSIRGIGHATINSFYFEGGRKLFESVPPTVLAGGSTSAPAEEVVDHHFFVDGDLTVSADSASLPAAFAGKKSIAIDVRGQHGDLFLYPPARRAVKDFLEPFTNADKPHVSRR